MIDTVLGHRLIDLRERIVEGFDAGNWEELGLLTGASAVIERHPRLLRGLHWGDEDYSGNVLIVIRQIVERDPRTLPVIQSYVDQKFPGEATYISAKPAERQITFSPYVFHVPEPYMELDLVSVMMPFSMEFDSVYDAIRMASDTCGLRCLRADDIWEDSTIVQDVFSLIFRAQVVIVDFTAKNPNVMYETGIAHTLGRHIIPISQSLDDVPFDMRHHRVLKYLPNAEGLSKLTDDLKLKLRQFSVSPPPAAITVPDDDDDIPF
ncbi:MAG: hypothetical protein ACREX4_13510 [Gammaproteobacteria bacterium]